MLDVDKQNTGSGRVQQGPASARLPLVVTGGSQLHDPAGCTFVDSSFGPPFLTAESFRVNEGFALAGVAALSRCTARRSHSHQRIKMAGLDRAEVVSVDSVGVLDRATVLAGS